MSIAAQTASALGRASVIAAAAVAMSGPLRDWLAARRGWSGWALLLAPFLTPPLLVSYAFSKVALALIVSPWSHAALYGGMLFLKLVPLAVIVRALVPSPLSTEARHCRRMLAASSHWSRFVFEMRGAGPAPWIAGGLVFLLAFADFELASLWSVKTWTVAIFDAQAGGFTLSESLRLAALPLGIQLVVLAILVPRSRHLVVTPAALRPARNPRALLAYAAAAFVTCALPLLVVAAQAAAGLRLIAENFVLGGEVLASLLFAFGAAALATLLARRGFVFAVPGLLGALVVSLLILTLFQTRILHPAYDTPLPLLLALTVLLLPAASLLAHLLRARKKSPAFHVARALGSRRLAWELDLRPRFAAFGLLFCMGYFDFTASSLLAPVGMTPVFVRLHNLAHYGQAAVLSAMMLAAFATPVVLLLLTAAAAELYARSHGR